MGKAIHHIAVAGALAGLATLTAYQAEARGFGGGARGGGAMSMSRGGGGMGGMNRGGGGMNRAGEFGGGNFSRGGTYDRPSGGNINRGNINRGNINRGNINSGNINRGNINTGDININRDVHVDVNNGWNGWHGYYDHPVGAYAAGVAVGAAVTAAVVGSRYYALPAGCAPYPYGGFTYYSCSNVWYKPTYQGDTIVYVVVNRPY